MDGGSSVPRSLTLESQLVLTDTRSLLTAGGEIHTAQDLKGLSVIIFFFECLEESLLLFFPRGSHCAVILKREAEKNIK